ncbi:MAG: LytTR family transcriptional regulator DNA-binding domain-containing protein [Bacteroidia bacterium]
MKHASSNIFDNPYSLVQSIQGHLMRCMFLGFFVFLMIWFFQPFEASATSKVFAMSIGAGGFTVILLAAFNKVLFNRYKAYFNTDYWTVGREIKWGILNMLLVLITLIVFVFLFGQIQLAAQQFFTFLLFATLFGILPIFLTTLYKQSSLKRMYHKSAELLNAKLNSRALLHINSKIDSLFKLQLSPTNVFQIPMNSLLYIKVIENEILLFHMEGENILSTALVISRESLAAQTQAITDILDCHQNYLVNLTKLIHITGNARGYYLHLSGVMELIPVSHFFDAELKRRLSSY